MFSDTRIMLEYQSILPYQFEAERQKKESAPPHKKREWNFFMNSYGKEKKRVRTQQYAWSELIVVVKFCDSIEKKAAAVVDVVVVCEQELILK